MDKIRQRRVLHDVLLQVLAENAEGFEIHNVYDRIEAQYTFPEEWYRQLPSAQGYAVLSELGFSDWRNVPQELLTRLITTEPQWKNEIRWARNELRKEGYLDLSAPRGRWRLTESGRQAAARSDQSDLTQSERSILLTRKAKAGEAGRPTSAAVGRSDLLKKLQLYTHSMPLDDLEMLVEIAWTVRKRSVPSSLDAA